MHHNLRISLCESPLWIESYLKQLFIPECTTQSSYYHPFYQNHSIYHVFTTLPLHLLINIWKVKVNLFCRFCNTVPSLLPFSLLISPTLPQDLQLLIGQLFVNTSIRPMSALFTARIHNLFLAPYSSAISDFITKLAKFYENFTSTSATECIALKAAIMLPALLQKTYSTSDVKVQ